MIRGDNARSSSAAQARERLSRLRRHDSNESFRKRLNPVHSEWSERNRLGAGHHIRAMFDVALDEAIALAELGEVDAAPQFLDDCITYIVAWITNPAGRTDNTIARGVLQSLTIEFRNRLDRQLERRSLEQTFSAEGPRRGRRKGTGLDAQDEKLFPKMKRLIESGKAASANEAAGMVADAAKGASFEAKKDRLGRKYREWVGEK